MVQAKLESKKRIGILGGTFDPAHIGHIKISKVAKKILKLDKIIWAITSKNPFKNDSLININKRIAFARKTNLKNSNLLDLENVRGSIISSVRPDIYISSKFAEYNYSDQNSKSNISQKSKHDQL